MVHIPKTQTAAVIPQFGASLQIQKDYPVKQPSELAPGECLLKMICTGVCHTDLHAAHDDWPLHGSVPLVGGHEGVGIVVAIGQGTNRSPVKIGDRVGVKWLADSCLNCEQCKQGREQNCDEVKNSGFTVDGTFAEYVVSYVNHVTRIPEGYDSNEAASILCAGVTTYRAIKYSNTQVGNWIVILGAGGGLGHLAVQYAIAKGCRVVAVDTGAEKKQLALSLGAERWIDFRETKDLVADVKAATGGLGAHAAIVTASSGEAFQQAVDYLRPGGSLMAVGLPGTATLQASIFWTVLKSINIIGSYVGNRQDADEALEIAARGKVKVHYALKPLSELKNVYEDMEQGKFAGRVVLSMPDAK